MDRLLLFIALMIISAIALYQYAIAHKILENDAAKKEQYELSEHCAKRAGQALGLAFDGKETNTADGYDDATYQNHYSAAQNKCFAITITTRHNTKDGSFFQSQWLRDLNENKDIGSFTKHTSFGKGSPPTVHILECDINKQVCYSETEWDELVKPYMEN